ncbi:hypothetical protein ACLI4Y_02160 [Natrialbaceae archaeon A-CW3]
MTRTVTRAVTVGPDVLEGYARFSLYNSPYPAHDDGSAIDLYPGTLRDGRTTEAPSPVSGTVLETRTVRAPPKPYAPEHDHLLLIECTAPASVEGLVARVLHVEPAVEAGATVEAGDSLGRLVRAGFFAPWVDNHLHVGFRTADQHLYRATGSLPIELGLEVTPLEWDGTGTVVETGETYAVLDAPRHLDPGNGFVGIAADGGGVLDGGIPHYDGGGVLSRDDDQNRRNGKVEGRHEGDGECRRNESEVRLNDDVLGVSEGRTIAWNDVTVTVDGTPVTGLSCFCARDGGFGAKLICPDRTFDVGSDVRVGVERSGDLE